MLPVASAITTLRRTVTFRKCIQPLPILVMKLKTASDPTAKIGGTLRPKISTGSRSTPPPRPVIPIRVPTTRPIRILAAISIQLLSRGRSGVNANESLALQMQDDLLGGFFGRQIRGVDDYFRVFRLLIRVWNTCELLDNAGTRLGVKTLAIALLTGFEPGRDVHQNESSERFDHTAYLFAN